MTDHLLLFYLLIFITAALYSSVGHGGASAYLALMSLFSLPPTSIKPVALVLNIIVSMIAFIQFYRRGYFDKKIFIILASSSIPFAFAGGLISIHPDLYKQILGILLFLSAIRLFIPMKDEIGIQKKYNLFLLIFAGASIGFISGIIGIGGGILLSPFLILIGYASVRNTAGISALFIAVNSIAGLLGQMKQGFEFSASMSMMIILAVIGALGGAYIGSRQLNIPALKKLLAFVLLIASLKLVFV